MRFVDTYKICFFDFQDKDYLFCRVVWVMDYLMQFFHFGWVSKLHGDFFLLQVMNAYFSILLFAALTRFTQESIK